MYLVNDFFFKQQLPISAKQQQRGDSESEWSLERLPELSDTAPALAHKPAATALAHPRTPLLPLAVHESGRTAAHGRERRRRRRSEHDRRRPRPPSSQPTKLSARQQRGHRAALQVPHSVQRLCGVYAAGSAHSTPALGSLPEPHSRPSGQAGAVGAARRARQSDASAHGAQVAFDCASGLNRSV